MLSGFFCQDAYIAKTKNLTDEELGRLMRALMKYHSTGEETVLDGRESIAYDFIKEDIDAAEESYAKKCEQARANRMKRAPTAVNAGQRAYTDVDGGTRASTVVEQEKRKRFTPPTIDEVKAYCQERENSVDPERFIDFYASKGWKVGNQPMKDWKACVRTWEQRGGRGNDQHSGNGGSSATSDRTDYSFLNS